MAKMSEEKMALEEELKEVAAKEENMAKELRRLEEDRDSFEQVKDSLKKVGTMSFVHILPVFVYDSSFLRPGRVVCR